MQLNMPVCPESYIGIAISLTRKKQMGSCLYQLLQNPEVVPLDFTWARNIIDRFIEDNDGYKVLYAFVAPILKKDMKLSAPVLSECSDIHEYSRKFNSYIKVESLAKRQYKPKETVNMFLEGMDLCNYQGSITRVRALLDGDSVTDVCIPEVLEPDQLPETLERYLREKTGTTSTVRIVSGHKQSSRSREDGKGTRTDRSNEMTKVNKDCGTCHLWGHLKSQCTGFARYLLFKEANKSIDDVKRSKIMDKYKAEMKLKNEAKMKQQKLGTVRQMWE